MENGTARCETVEESGGGGGAGGAGGGDDGGGLSGGEIAGMYILDPLPALQIMM